MQNSTTNRTRFFNYRNDPKFQLFARLRRQCFKENGTHSSILTDNYDEDGAWCPRTFDGFSCWDPTPASATAFQPCPDFLVGFDPRRFAYKKCTENGTWYISPGNHKPWTNYTTCVDVEDLDFRTLINTIYVVGYSLSVAALILSIIVFLFFRSLQCTRIRIHVHLFSSFALNNILWIVWYRAVVNKVVVVQNNREWCQMLHVITNYFMVTSYFWMFCEGLHLHIALVVVFVKDEVAMRWFVALGWGVSLIITAVYATVRYYTPGATERCWMDESDTIWIIAVPVGISLLASFVFLINVVRVLLTKLHPAPNQHASVAAKKAARAALILIPLFGLHFMLIPLRPLPDSPGEKLYQVASALLTSLQGLCVAILFCFTNHDVMIATKTYMSRFRRANEAIAMTGNTYPLTGCNRG
ncbi:calcitonin gene-related peptide type 1 receptor-like isoform X2 [Anticarsia gemmatalis]|uniref:calcitonin gene-related peptide type 1 receptor-like isoform X2 n=1 Tax=Anticarsia gemmatalis TaxID=129554 RepID=UPI003F76D533